MSQEKTLDAEIVAQPEITIAPVHNVRKLVDDVKSVATMLQGLIQAKPKPLKFNDEVYIEVDDWTFISKMHGCAPRIVDTRFVTFPGASGDVRGFEADCEVVHIATGTVVSRASSMCCDDEEKWSVKPKYDWKDVVKPDGSKVMEFNHKFKKDMPKREKVRVGEERVPLFQIRSMAQTRATSKAQATAWKYIAALAGYKTTPAEEMAGTPAEPPAPEPVFIERVELKEIEVDGTKTEFATIFVGEGAEEKKYGSSKSEVIKAAQSAVAAEVAVIIRAHRGRKGMIADEIIPDFPEQGDGRGE